MERSLAALGDDCIGNSFRQRTDMRPKLKMGMVGGGRDPTIGVIHQMAARLDGKIELVAGVFSSIVDFVSVVTPNQFALSGRQDLLEIGFNVICDSR